MVGRLTSGLILLTLGIAVLPRPALAETVLGLARLIDGDTIEIGNQRIRLSGIDTPEPAQRCYDDRDKEYRCGKRASDELNRLIRGRPVVCTGSERGEHGRLIAECTAGDTSLNREMVRLGWAVAYEEYSDKYVSEALEASKAGRGIWRGTFMKPHDFRALRWKVEAQVAPEGCPIKGNIRENKIYHTPWSPHYHKTRINTAKGERWFCSEAEAIRAGWRPPYR